jgi:hypothetical protein
MDSLENGIGEKRLCVRHHVRKIRQVGPHPIQDFGRGSLTNYPNKFDLKHGRLLLLQAETPASRVARNEVNPGRDHKAASA